MFGRDEKVSSFRLTAVQYIILVIFLVLAYGLWRLQVVSSEFYAALAEKNKTREVPILAPRGKILDREGREIVTNYPSFTALLLRDSTRDLTVDADLIAQGLHLDPREVRERLRKFAGTPQYQPIYLKEDITQDELAFIKAHRNELPELDTIMAHRRLYPRNGFMAHLIGYVGEVSEGMLNQPQWELYNPGDVVGKSGVELQYNQVLMGKNGSRQVLVNSKGKEVGELDEKPAVPGHALKLTLDIDLQIAAEEAMGDKNGAMVAMDPRTGEILAMVSRPTFDPNDFAVLKNGHGAVDITKAIYQSCDVFFYTLAEKLGISRIAKYATAMGLGQKTGIDLPEEASGVMPSEEWKVRNFKQKWFAGETISVGIGQGAVATTPVQLMRAIAAISMDGRMVVPHVASPTGLPQDYLETHNYTEVKTIPIDGSGFNLITDAMSRVLLPEGTAPSAHVPGIDIAGKTGSAQIVSLAVRAKHANNEALNQNGWFVGFTPRRNPDIIVAVLFEGGEHGKLAARLATQVIKAYVDKQHRQPTKVASGAGKVEIGAVWNAGSGDDDELQGGHFVLPGPNARLPLATAAPGLE